ncbi:hypothetical protein [Altericroceibacterium endophyticum]|uniref:hypothetical protein n=1 Tax=Altericroceibacterium endophyticum TaxID=1808508 RepID=UPI0019286885|nr:hypothetical protein [Altericroceibacterium endophyticum]
MKRRGRRPGPDVVEGEIEVKRHVFREIDSDAAFDSETTLWQGAPLLIPVRSAPIKINEIFDPAR